jgi:hypothetical protein
MLFVPNRPLAIRCDDDASRIIEHPERVFDCFVARTDDRDPFSANAITVAVFAKKHAVPEAFLHAGNLRWQMENSGGN